MATQPDPTHDDLPKSDDDWRSRLTEEQFRITRQQGTERAFTGEYWNCKAAGTYQCVCCQRPLFHSESKFDSGSGWPSFWQPIEDVAVETEQDSSHSMRRTEVHCRHCGAHLGHIFDDGPKPTGLRYCINSASLQLRSSDEE